MLWSVWMALSVLLSQPQPVTITEIVTERVFVPIELRYFQDGDEIRQYLDGRPVNLAADNQDCDDLARFFVADARRAGYDVAPQYLSAYDAAAYGFSGKHMLVMAMTQDNAIYYIEPSTNQLWYVSVID